jgi:uncharacterized damage-inducible protein DinB
MTSEALLSSLIERLHHERRDVHNGVLGLVEDLTEEQLRWRPGPRAPSIGFHVWHLARYADKDRSDIEGTPQFWVEQSLAAAWGFPAALGEADTGTEMADDASDLLVLPSKAALLDYTRSAFNALGECLEALPVGSLLEAVRPPALNDRRVDVLWEYVTHDNRHLGMIEALKGLLGKSGTATR